MKGGHPGSTRSSWAVLGLTVVFAVAGLRVPAAADDAPLTAESLFQHVIETARDEAERRYQPDRPPLPEAIADMSYDQYRAIRFRRDSALWQDGGHYEVQLFHPGFLYRNAVRLHELDAGRLSPTSVDADDFHYDGPASDLRKHVPDNMNVAGFRLHFPLNSADYKDELVVFLGASYFRLLGRGHRYGLSGRGLTIDTASADGEEFPEFREFWLVRPAPDATTITVLARLDSPSVTGAYRFDIEPGSTSVMEVDAFLFARRDIANLGVAPLTSMFFHGDTSHRNPDDFRRHIHDSDGLLMETAAGEWLWRPLNNREKLRISSLRDTHPRGFGLLQRARDFEDFLDLEARYDLRPSHWIEPLGGDWNSGGVELVEIPTESEINDNIVSYWSPEEPFRAGQERHYRYRVLSFDRRLPRQPLAEVIRTRQGWAAVPGTDNPPPRSERRFIVDFHGGELTGLNATHPVEPTLEVARGRHDDLWVRQLPDGETWRASFRLRPNSSEPADMRLRLQLNGRPVSETWTYVWYPDAIR